MFIAFFLLWIIFNGSLTLEIAIFGLMVSAVIYLFLCKFMNFSLKKDIYYMKKLPLLIQYMYVLVKEIAIANVAAIKLVLSTKQVIEPCIVRFRTDLKSGLSRFLLANSITLTPGTITVSVEDDLFTVHCLDKSMSEGMDESAFVQLLRKIEAR